MSIPKLEFPPFHLPDEAEALRGEVRAFLKETLPKLRSEAFYSETYSFLFTADDGSFARVQFLVSKDLGCRLTNITNSECIDQTVERLGF